MPSSGGIFGWRPEWSKNMEWAWVQRSWDRSLLGVCKEQQKERHVWDRVSQEKSSSKWAPGCQGQQGLDEVMTRLCSKCDEMPSESFEHRGDMAPYIF